VLPIPATFGQPGVTSGKPAAGAALRTEGAAGRVPASAAALGQVVLQPAEPLLPLELGFAGAVPLTWLQRRLRISRSRRSDGGHCENAGHGGTAGRWGRRGPAR
jgi:hypothetical protein